MMLVTRKREHARLAAPKPSAPRWLAFGVLGVGTIGVSVAGFSMAYGKRFDATSTVLANLTDSSICLSDASRAATTFSEEMAAANERMHHAMNDLAPSGDPERDFLRAMILHHQGAVDMARALLKVGGEVRVERLAQSIIVEQAYEITYMQMLLDRPAGAVDGSARQ